MNQKISANVAFRVESPSRSLEGKIQVVDLHKPRGNQVHQEHPGHSVNILQRQMESQSSSTTETTTPPPPDQSVFTLMLYFHALRNQDKADCIIYIKKFEYDFSIYTRSWLPKFVQCILRCNSDSVGCYEFESGDKKFTLDANIPEDSYVIGKLFQEYLNTVKDINKDFFIIIEHCAVVLCKYNSFLNIDEIIKPLVEVMVPFFDDTYAYYLQSRVLLLKILIKLVDNKLIREDSDWLVDIYRNLNFKVSNASEYLVSLEFIEALVRSGYIRSDPDGSLKKSVMGVCCSIHNSNNKVLSPLLLLIEKGIIQISSQEREDFKKLAIEKLEGGMSIVRKDFINEIEFISLLVDNTLIEPSDVDIDSKLKGSVLKVYSKSVYYNKKDSLREVLKLLVNLISIKLIREDQDGQLMNIVIDIWNCSEYNYNSNHAVKWGISVLNLAVCISVCMAKMKLIQSSKFVGVLKNIILRLLAAYPSKALQHNTVTLLILLERQKLIEFNFVEQRIIAENITRIAPELSEGLRRSVQTLVKKWNR